MKNKAGLKFPWTKPYLCAKEKQYLVDAFDSTWISGGKYVDQFENEFKRSLGSDHGLTTSNGTAALHLLLLALGIKKGDEVIVPGFTFAASVNMVLQTKATPVYIDIDPLTWCIDPRLVEKNITDKTKAIIAVHTYGNVCDMNVLKSLAEKYDLTLIEDAAEAAFSKFDDKYAGTFGDGGCFSFQATKTMVTGEGGFVATNDKGLFQRMNIIRDHGMSKSKRYWHDCVGHNFRLTNLQAAVGMAQLENITQIISQRQRVYNEYQKHLADLPGVSLQKFNSRVDPVVWTMAVKIDAKNFKGDRDFLIKLLEDVGVESRTGFYPFSIMPFFKAPVLPISEEVSANVICLPLYCDLKDDEVQFICDQLKKLIK